MCGVFGFIARGDKDVDLGQLRRIARTTQSRGEHAFGFSWIDRKNRLKMFKQNGPISDYIGILNIADDARMLIGHCRYATQGRPSDNSNNHPHSADGGWLVHNGMIHDYQNLIQRHCLWPVTDCDSEVLGLLIENTAGGLVDRSRAAVNATRRSPLVTLGLWNRPRTLVAVRRGNPLHLGIDRTGYYLGSLSDDLPGNVLPVPDNTVLEFARGTLTQSPLYDDDDTPFKLEGGRQGMPDRRDVPARRLRTSGLR